MTRWKPWMVGIVAFAFAGVVLLTARVLTGDAWCVCYAFILGCWYSARIVFELLALGLLGLAGGFAFAALLAVLGESRRLSLVVFVSVVLPAAFVAFDQVARGYVQGLVILVLLIPGAVVVTTGRPAARASAAVAIGLFLGLLVPILLVFMVSTC